MRVYQVAISLPKLFETLSLYEGENATLFKEMYIDKLKVIYFDILYIYISLILDDYNNSSLINRSIWKDL